MSRGYRGQGMTRGLLGNAPFQNPRSGPLLEAPPGRTPIGGPNMGVPIVGGPNMGVPNMGGPILAHPDMGNPDIRGRNVGGPDMGSGGGINMGGPTRMSSVGSGGRNPVSMSGGGGQGQNQLGLVSELLKSVVDAASLAANQINNQPSMGSSYHGGQGHMPGASRPVSEGLLGGPPSANRVNAPGLMSVQGGPRSQQRGLLSPPVSTAPQLQAAHLLGPGGMRAAGQGSFDIPPRQGALLPSPSSSGHYGGGNYGNRNNKPRYQHGTNRQQSYKKTESSEEYDPANPTEDEGSDVTSRLTNKRIAGFEDGGPQAKRRSDERYGGGSSATMESTLYHCHLCNKSYSNTADFEVHMQSDTHRATSDAYARMHAQQTEQQIQRMRATQHLKDVENDESEKCRICVKTLLIPYEQHCMLKEHQHKAKLVKKGCILCKTGSFANYQLYKEHIDLESHKKAKDELNRSKQSKEEATESASNGRAEPEEVKKPTDDRKAEKEESQAVKEAKQNKEKKREASGEKRDQAKPAREQEQKATKPEAVLEPEVDVYEDSAYDPDVAVGQGHVVAVKGFFCKLCHKFYRSEELAKVVHCKSQSHFAKYQEFIISQQQENDSSTMDDKIDAPSAKAERQANLTEHKVHKTSGNPPTDKKSSSPRYPTARRGRRR